MRTAASLTDRVKTEIDANPRRAFERVLDQELKSKRGLIEELVALCPFHEDHHPSLRVNLAKVVWHCDPCGKGGDVIALAKGKWGEGFIGTVRRLAELLGVDSGARRQPASEQSSARADDKKDSPETRTHFEVRDLGGELKATHHRIDFADSSKKKTIWWEPKGIKPQELPLYGINRTADSNDGDPIIVTEGEKAADSLWDRTYLAVGTVTGSASIPCDESLTDLLRFTVYLWPDNDQGGRKHMQAIAERLLTLDQASEVFFINWKGAPAKGDAADFDGDVDGLIAEAEPITAERLKQTQQRGNESPGDEPVVDLKSDPKPAITVRPGRRVDIVNAVELVLVENAETLQVFQRVSEIVRVISLGGKALERANQGGNLRRPEGATILHPVTAVALGEIFDRLICSKKINKKGKEVPCDCPERIPVIYKSRVGFWDLPFLMGLIEAPCLRPDGTVLTEPGYDANTGLFLCGDEWPEIPDSPTRAQAEHALRVLREPFVEFPFVGEAESVLLSAILTALQRRTLASAPLHGFSAPSPRSGKSMLAEAVGIIATGRHPAAMAVASDKEEIRKAILAVLREGHLVINLDNLTVPLNSPDLAKAITQPIYSDRLLGATQTLRLPTNVLWLATGNNLSFGNDLPSRSLLCRIDAKVERPEERAFTITDLPVHLLDNRKRLVGAALTILRAYHQAGRPGQKVVPGWVRPVEPRNPGGASVVGLAGSL